MDCVHHWKIETPTGTESAGSCIRCGESRQFRNSSPDWDKFRGRRGAGDLSPQEKSLAKGTAASDATKVGAPGTRSTVRLGSLVRRVSCPRRTGATSSLGDRPGP